MKKFKTKYRLLVLLDHSKASLIALANAVNLAKVIDAGIDILNIKPGVEIANSSNQIAMMRALEEEKAKATKKMQELVNTISEVENIPIIFNFSIGNLINEIEEHISQTQPDVVVLGKRKQKLIGLIGDGLSNHLLKNHKGSLLISGNENTLTSFNDASLGFLNEEPNKEHDTIANELIVQTKKPLKVFKIVDNTPNTKTETNETTVVYEFDDSSEVSSSVSKYINQNKITLICVKRNINESVGGISLQITKTISKINVPVLVLSH